VALRDIVRSVAIALAAVPLASCGSDVLAPDVEQVHLTLTVSQPEIAVGDTVELRVVGTNPTRNTLRFTTYACAAFHVRILDFEGSVVFRHPTTCDSIGAERVIEPGDSLVQTVRFDGTVSNGPFQEPFTFARGLYRVVATPEGAAGNESNTVELRIRP
jgi:hypothetical protein